MRIEAATATTAFFFAGLMYLIVWSRGEMPRGTVYHGGANPATEAKIER